MTDQPLPRLNTLQRLFIRTFASTLPDVTDQLIIIAMASTWNSKPEVLSGDVDRWDDLPESERAALCQMLRDHMTGAGK